MEKKEYNILSIHEFGKQNREKKKEIKRNIITATLNASAAVMCYFAADKGFKPAFYYIMSILNAACAVLGFIRNNKLNNEHNELINTQVRELNEKLIDTENRLLVYKK